MSESAIEWLNAIDDALVKATREEWPALMLELDRIIDSMRRRLGDRPLLH